jgi:hypothetical protein
MASERQIAANRRNAQQSKGPKSESGKTRSSKNAFRHGLSVPMPTRSTAKFKDLSRRFAGNATGAETLEAAEQAADAHLELLRIRMVQTVIFERDSRLRSSDTESLYQRRLGIAQFLRDEMTSWESELLGPLASLPEGKEKQEPRPVTEALPNFIMTSRYQKRAMSQRDRAIQKIVSIKKGNNETLPA